MHRRAADPRTAGQASGSQPECAHHGPVGGLPPAWSLLTSAAWPTETRVIRYIQHQEIRETIMGRGDPTSSSRGRD